MIWSLSETKNLTNIKNWNAQKYLKYSDNKRGFLFLEIVVEVKVGGFDADVVLSGDAKDTLNWRSSLNRTNSLNGSSWDRSSSSYGLAGRRGGQGGGDGLLNEGSQLGNDFGDQVGIARRLGDHLNGWLRSNNRPGGSDERWGRSGRWWLTNGDEVLLDVAAFDVAVGSGGVADGDKAAERVNITGNDLKKIYIY